MVGKKDEQTCESVYKNDILCYLFEGRNLPWFLLLQGDYVFHHYLKDLTSIMKWNLELPVKATSNISSMPEICGRRIKNKSL